MTDKIESSYGDPWNTAFWEAAERRQLVMQHCNDCAGWQFYGRPFCLACDGTDLAWKPVSGKGRVYSMSRVHVSFDPAHETPYVVALIDLDEGPRLLGKVHGDGISIGDRVTVGWRERQGGPPLAVFVSNGDE